MNEQGVRPGIKNPVVTFATFLLLTVAFNSEWNSISTIWWGTILLYCVCSVFFGDMRFYLDHKYTGWWLCFMAFSALSALWAGHPNQVFTVVESLAVYTVLFFLLRSSIRDHGDIHKLIVILMLAAVVNGIYLLLTNGQMNQASAGTDGTLERLGSDGGWNANAIGMMMAISAVAQVYLFEKTKRATARVFLLLLFVVTMLVVLVTGSRKAIGIVLIGVSLFLMLRARGKRIRTLLILVIAACLLYYIMMEVQYFYAIIGWRFEAMFEGLTGAGQMDSSAELRKKYIEVAMKVFTDNPMIGCGLDNVRFFNALMAGRETYSHNNYTELLADLGILGTAIYYSGYFYVLVFTWKYRKKDNLVKLLVAFLVCIIITEYFCVSYSMFLFGLLLMIMFAWVSIEQAERAKANSKETKANEYGIQ